MTRQEKEEYYAQYWGQKVCNWENGYVFRLTPKEVINGYNIDDFCMTLRPLESITDEEVRSITTNSFQLASEFVEWILVSPFGQTWFQAEADALRSLGIATPWRSYSVDDLIKQGVLKLKTD